MTLKQRDNIIRFVRCSRHRIPDEFHFALVRINI